MLNRVAPNTNEIADEVIDGEAIIINLANGIYYSMDDVGGVVWSMIAAGHRLADIVTAIVVRYEVSPEQAEADVQRVVAELIENWLVVPADGDGPELAHPAPVPKLPYVPPRLTVYRDMGELLALDPPAPGLKDIPWKSSGGKPRD